LINVEDLSIGLVNIN